MKKEKNKKSPRHGSAFFALTFLPSAPRGRGPSFGLPNLSILRAGYALVPCLPIKVLTTTLLRRCNGQGLDEHDLETDNNTGNNKLTFAALGTPHSCVDVLCMMDR